ncbi:MAG: hypothetical protein DRH44_04490 [Candidatus Coatesbacteria bacterium]|nr:MAG: hypothetical protein DRH49_02690 [Candidatus Coatesbacteria bacterium]RLC43656.1 MAG: hypothetical protein DRH44_04490 [Candidatus Coatesbacteria bacterium]
MRRIDKIRIRKDENKDMIGADLKVTVRRRNGDTEIIYSGKSKSFVIAMLAHFKHMGKDYPNRATCCMKDWQGNSRYVDANNHRFFNAYWHTEEGRWQWGICFGSGFKGVEASDYQLENHIRHGTSSGQLYYYAGTYSQVIIDGNTAYFTATKSAENKHTDPITVREVAFMVRSRHDTSDYDFVIVRDRISDVTLEQYDTITVEYKFKVSA